MIELPDDHCYLVVRVFEELNGQKKTHIVGCFNQLSQANERAKSEAYEATVNSTVISHQNSSVIAPIQRTGLLDGLFFAFIAPNGGEDAADRVEIRVKRIPVQREFSISYTPTITPHLNYQPLSVGSELQVGHKGAMATVVSRCLGLVPPADILATRQRVESEIDLVPVEGYQSKYENYLAREEDISTLLSSSNSADTFLGQTLKYYTRRRLSLGADSHTLSSTGASAPTPDYRKFSSGDCQSPISEIDALLADAKLSSEYTEEAGSKVQSTKSPKPPISPLSLDDAVSPSSFSEKADRIVRIVAASHRMNGILETPFPSPPTNSRAENTTARSTPPRPRVTKSNQKDSIPRLNRFLRLPVSSPSTRDQHLRQKSLYIPPHRRSTSTRSSPPRPNRVIKSNQKNLSPRANQFLRLNPCSPSGRDQFLRSKSPYVPPHGGSASKRWRSRSSYSRSSGSTPSPIYVVSRSNSRSSRWSQGSPSPKSAVSRPSSQSSRRRTNSSSPKSATSRNSSAGSEFRNIQTSANTEANRGPGPAVRRQPRNSLDHSAYRARIRSNKSAGPQARAEQQAAALSKATAAFQAQTKQVERQILSEPRAMSQRFQPFPWSQLGNYQTSGSHPPKSTHHDMRILRQGRVHFEDEIEACESTNQVSTYTHTPAHVQDSPNHKSGWTVVNPKPIPILKTASSTAVFPNKKPAVFPDRSPLSSRRWRRNARTLALEERRNARVERL